MLPSLQVAIALNMYEEAARLYAKCGRYDLLSALLRSRGEFDKALDVCTKHDRLHLKATYFAYAKHLESLGEVKEAIAAYAESGTQCTEVPRMLWETGNLPLLAAFVHERKEKDLSRWLGRHYESDPDPEVRKQALDVYKEADDTYEVVRYLCAQARRRLSEPPGLRPAQSQLVSLPPAATAATARRRASLRALGSAVQYDWEDISEAATAAGPRESRRGAQGRRVRRRPRRAVPRRAAVRVPLPAQDRRGESFPRA